MPPRAERMNDADRLPQSAWRVSGEARIPQSFGRMSGEAQSRPIAKRTSREKTGLRLVNLRRRERPPKIGSATDGEPHSICATVTRAARGDPPRLPPARNPAPPWT
eukprot:scaffold70548_cov27-Tisochrysis_lutea.AAC.2